MTTRAGSRTRSTCRRASRTARCTRPTLETRSRENSVSLVRRARHLQARRRPPARSARRHLGVALVGGRVEARVAGVVQAAQAADREPLRLPAGPALLSV